MKKFIVNSLWFIVVAALALNGCAKRQIINTASTGANIICFGDSITFGYGVSPGEDYPSVLGKMLNNPVINVGVDGDTSADGLQRLKSDVLERDPLIVIIEFGGNDFIKEVSKADTLKNVSQMIDRIQGHGAMVAIVDISAGIFMKEYRALLDKLAVEKGAIFIPGILSGIITNPSMKSDFLHPNADGYKLIAQKVYRKISPYLKVK